MLKSFWCFLYWIAFHPHSDIFFTKEWIHCRAVVFFWISLLCLPSIRYVGVCDCSRLSRKYSSSSLSNNWLLYCVLSDFWNNKNHIEKEETASISPVAQLMRFKFFTQNWSRDTDCWLTWQQPSVTIYICKMAVLVFGTAAGGNLQPTFTVGWRSYSEFF